MVHIWTVVPISVALTQNRKHMPQNGLAVLDSQLWNKSDKILGYCFNCIFIHDHVLYRQIFSLKIA